MVARNTKINYSLQDIFIYPVKSLGGIALNESFAENRGLQFDRRWMLIDKNNNFLTQRKLSEMALIEVSISNDVLEINHKTRKLPTLKVPLTISNSATQKVTVWSDQVSAPVMEDNDIQEWFFEALHEKVRMVFMDDKASRPVDPEYAINGELVSFADGFPFLVTNQASLDDLNNRLEMPVPMQRFRPNLVIAGAQPFEEDNWNEIQIGAALFKVVKPCGRCVVTTIDQKTAEKGTEPLKTLSTFRKFGSKIIFGQNMVLIKPGLIVKENEIKVTFR
ncbi:MOSC domain-containing protein [soil metagenome]